VDRPGLETGVNILKSHGLHVHFSKHVFDQNGYLAGSDSARLEDLHSMYENRDINAVFCARGGYGCMRLLDKINYELIRENPKIFMGFSDVTALLLAVYKQTDMVTFHGPMIGGLSSSAQEALLDSIGLLEASQGMRINLRGGTVLSRGRASGPMVGGNLTLVCHLIGTGYLPPVADAIFFLEEKGEAPYRIDRMLTHLSLTGIFRSLGGIILGTFQQCGEEKEITRLLREKFAGLGIPIMTGLPAGHGVCNRAIPIGLPVDFDTDTGTVTLRAAPVV
jgi:muramoyltetrapeptide carboxypeptidase